MTKENESTVHEVSGKAGDEFLIRLDNGFVFRISTGESLSFAVTAENPEAQKAKLYMKLPEVVRSYYAAMADHMGYRAVTGDANFTSGEMSVLELEEILRDGFQKARGFNIREEDVEFMITDQSRHMVSPFDVKESARHILLDLVTSIYHPKASKNPPTDPGTDLTRALM